jgi:hypothetical protein
MIARSKGLSGHAKIEELFSTHIPNEEEQEAMRRIRYAAKAFALVLHENTPRCSARERAVRKVDEAVMVANAAIARKGVCY